MSMLLVLRVLLLVLMLVIALSVSRDFGYVFVDNKRFIPWLYRLGKRSLVAPSRLCKVRVACLGCHGEMNGPSQKLTQRRGKCSFNPFIKGWYPQGLPSVIMWPLRVTCTVKRAWSMEQIRHERITRVYAFLSQDCTTRHSTTQPPYSGPAQPPTNDGGVGSSCQQHQANHHPRHHSRRPVRPQEDPKRDRDRDGRPVFELRRKRHYIGRVVMLSLLARHTPCCRVASASLVRVRRTSPRTLSFPAHVLDKDKPKIVVRETQKGRLDDYSLLCDRRVRRSLVVGGRTIRYGSCSGESRLLRRDQPRVKSGVRV
jgi:hypothetical protein